MTSWRETVADRAVEVVEYLGVEDGHRARVEDALVSDSLFIETALAWSRAANAESSTHRAEPETDTDRLVLSAHDNLRDAARHRGAEVLADLDGVDWSPDDMDAIYKPAPRVEEVSER